MKRILVILLIIIIMIVPMSAMAFDYTIDEETGIKLYELPNGVKDEIIDGKLIKKVSDKYITNSANISGYVSATTVNVDVVIFPLTSIPNLATSTDYDIDGSIVIEGTLGEISINERDNVNSIGKWYTRQSLNQLGFVVAKGTYSSLADAQANFPPQSLIYQLETPIVENIGGRVGQHKLSIIINEFSSHIKNISIAISKTVTEFFYDGEAITTRGILFFAYVAMVFCLSVLAIVFKRR